MKRRGLVGMLFVIGCVWMLALSGCGGSSSSETGGSTPAALTSFSEDVALCTPQVEPVPEALTKGIVSEDSASISVLGGWDPTQSNTVLYNLLTTNSVEGMFDPVTKADMFVTILNSFREHWLTDGTYPVTMNLDLSETVSAYLDLHATVDNSVKSVPIPFFTDEPNQAVDRVITLTGTITMSENDVAGDPENLEAEIAFATTANGEVVVTWTHFETKGETSSFYGIKDDDTGALRAWATCYVDHGGGDIMEIALKWSGNTQDGTFALTQYKNSGGGTHILAGGEADGLMGFLAQIPEDVDSGGDPWFLVSTTNYLSGNAMSAEDGEYLDDSDALAAALAGDDPGVCAYLNETANGTSLGYLDAYPESADDILPMVPLPEE